MNVQIHFPDFIVKFFDLANSKIGFIARFSIEGSSGYTFYSKLYISPQYFQLGVFIILSISEISLSLYKDVSIFSCFSFNIM